MDLDWIPVEKSWRLNEKHYGMLQGLNKSETAEKYGDEQVLIWRRSFDVPPTPMDKEDARSPFQDPRYAGVDEKDLPLTESLKECIARILPYWENNIRPALEKEGEVLVAAHGNSLR
jgi:2,3-bisphosphoglycerate-dependent phosphoglycerate mutase